jgi:endonuclease/exonuclease/phosphatase (EEP) superfamily protein YafD
MRVLSWNTADHFDRKAGRLLALNADIMVLPEVRRQHADALGERYATHWFGDVGKRGLLVAAQKPLTLNVVKEAEKRHAALISVANGRQFLQLVPIWAMPSGGSYVRPLCSALDELLPLIEPEGRVLVAGDFNASQVFDKGRGVTNHFSAVSSRLERFNLQSIWHERTGESFGQETRATYFHQWRADQAFHIDYAFACTRLRQEATGLEIGAISDWLKGGSDHMPLIMDFRLG